MLKKIAVVGPDKPFFSIIEEKVRGFYPNISWLKFNTGLEIINYCLVNKELPDIIFTEYFLFKIDGIMLIDYLSTYFPVIKVICVIDELDNNVIVDVSEAGAAGLIKKSDVTILLKFTSSSNDVCRIVKDSLGGITSLCSRLNKTFFYYRNMILKKYRITKRESTFLLLNATGLDYSEIAKIMFISKRTVDNLFQSTAKKFGVQNRHNLTLFCIKMKLAKFSTVRTITSKNKFVIKM